MARIKQRGSVLIYLGLALGILLVLSAIAYKIHDAGYQAGEKKIQSAWDDANRQAGIKERDRRTAAAEITGKLSKAAQEAADDAAFYKDQWERSKNEAHNKGISLANCQSTPKPRTSTTTKLVERDPAPDEVGSERANVRVTWMFVGLWDSAWTDNSGKPLFGDTAGILAQAGATDPSASTDYGLETVLNAHKANAEKHDTCRRDLNRLIDSVERLKVDWDKRFTAVK